MTDAEAGRTRDFLGYGRQPPDPRWPNGAHIAVNFVINYEEGGEYSVPDGDSASEAAEAVAAIREAGWDVAGHGLRWEMHVNLAPETEREHIRLATEIITKCMGRRPEGWYSRYAPSLSTRAILLDAGYSYDSDAYDDELPYWVKVGSRDQLVFPLFACAQ